MISSNAGSRFGVLRHYSTGDIVFGSSSKNFFLFWSKASLNTSFFVPKKSPHGDEFRFSAPSYLMSSMPRSSSSDFVLEQVFLKLIIKSYHRGGGEIIQCQKLMILQLLTTTFLKEFQGKDREVNLIG